MTNWHCSEPFADWLDVTWNPDDAPAQELHDWLISVDAWPFDLGKYRLGEGTVFVQHRKRFSRVSISGGALEYMRVRGVFVDCLSLLGSSPHRVTRLDAAVDTNEAGPAAVERYRALYPEVCYLTHKPVKVSCFLSADREGQQTGTWYAGHRTDAKVTARVYDKAHQLYEKRGELWGPRTRYEVTLRGKVGPTLKDAYDPCAAFWHYAAPALLDAPDDAPPWGPGTAEGWESTWEPPLPAAVLKRRVSESLELDVLVDLADKAGPEGRNYLLSLLRRRILPASKAA